MAHRDGCERPTMEGAGQRSMKAAVYSPQADLYVVTQKQVFLVSRREYVFLGGWSATLT